jgi:trk system potassium uptake protein TrkH
MKNFNFRFIFKTIGFLLIIESILLMVSAVVSFYYHEKSGDQFLISASITLVVGIALRLLGVESSEKIISKREGFVVVSFSWIILSAFGMLPFYLSGTIPRIPDAYFEVMSGFTTTGCTIIPNVDKVPFGLLFWRSLTQWVGGLGIIVFALAVLPIIGGNASFLYDAETTGITRDRFQPRITQVAKRLLVTYIALTAIIIFLLWIGPMNLFDSVCHALATASTGGFSTKQASIAYWNSPYVEYVVSIFMLVGGVNFSLIYFLFNGKPKRLLEDEEIRWYLGIYIVFTFIIFAGLFFSGRIHVGESAFRTSMFQVVSAITTTGFSTANFVDWGPFYAFLIYALMLVCGCAGSTSGGMKVIRIVVLFKNAVNEFKRQVHPNAILPVRINKHVLPVEVVTKTLAFIFLYMCILFVSFLVLSFTGVAFEDSITASVSCMGNVGLGSIGNTSNFAGISDPGKWFLSLLMLTGRLELFTVLSLFMPAFWKK